MFIQVIEVRTGLDQTGRNLKRQRKSEPKREAGQGVLSISVKMKTIHLPGHQVQVKMVHMEVLEQVATSTLCRTQTKMIVEWILTTVFLQIKAIRLELKMI
jgi:hypothetical protein